MARYVRVEEDGDGSPFAKFVFYLILAGLIVTGIKLAIFVLVVLSIYAGSLRILPRTTIALTIYAGVGWMIGFRISPMLIGWTAAWFVGAIMWSGSSRSVVDDADGTEPKALTGTTA